jgi:hypothetical protein
LELASYTGKEIILGLGWMQVAVMEGVYEGLKAIARYFYVGRG